MRYACARLHPATRTSSATLADRTRCHPLTISDGFSRYLLRCEGVPAEGERQGGRAACHDRGAVPADTLALVPHLGLPAAQAAAQEKRRLEIEELRKQGKWKTHEDVERDQRDVEDAERRRQHGVIGKLKDLVVGAN